MSWADKARSCVHSKGTNNGVERDHVVTPLELELVQEGMSRKFFSQTSIAPICTIPIDTWVIISCFLSFSELQALSSTCRYLWVQLHARDSMWKSQLLQFRCDMADTRVDKRLLCTGFLGSPKQSAYERMKLEHRLYALDTRREWYLRDIKRSYRADGIFSYPLTLEDDTEVAVDDAWDAYVVPLTQIRILRPVLETSLDHSNAGSGIFNGVVERATFTPSEYMTLCDNINREDFAGSRICARECTADEDEFFLFALLQTLRLAKRRPTTQRVQSDVRTPYHRLLRYFGGVLISICRVEAEHILSSILYMPNLLQSFVISRDLAHRDQDNLVKLCHTRYFIAPEMCRQRRVGLVIADPVRVMVIVGKECDTRDDPRWDEAQMLAAEEGRAAPGTGMNPQNRRRPL